MDTYEIIEYLRKRECVLYNLQSFIEEITYKIRSEDSECYTAIRNIILAILTTSCEHGPEHESYVTWNRSIVIDELKHLRKKLGLSEG